MEKDCKRKKQQMKMKERSPLQNLNGLPFHKRSTKNSSNLSSSANAVSGLLPSNPCSSSSNSGFNLDKKSKPLSKLAKSEPNKSRSKENEVPKNSISQKCEKNQSQWKNYRKPIYTNGRISKLSSIQGNPESRLKKGPQENPAKTKNSRQNDSGKRALELNGVSNSSNLNNSDNFSPVERVDSLNFGNNVMGDSVYEGDNGDFGSDSKTPPVEASLSPEINCQSHSRILVLKSEATPVCYGAGHLVSGVTDKRKCRRRGSLRGGSEKVNFDDENGDGNVVSGSIPLLAEGSVRWHLSPSKEGCEDLEVDYTNRLNRCRMVYNHDKSSYSGFDSVKNVANQRRNKNVVLSPRKGAQIQGLLEPSRCNVVDSLLVTSPSVSYNGSLRSGNNSKLSAGSLSSGNNSKLSFGSLSSGNISKLSICSLSSGNIIQTPDSESDVCVGRSRLDVHQSSFIWPELDSTTETLEGVKLPRGNEMSMWDGTELGFDLADKVQKNVDSVSSWVSDSTLGNLSLSHMRISWRDGTLRSTSVENDELDCCCILSDDEAARDGKTCKGGIESTEIKENNSRMGNDLSPVLLDYEPCVFTKGKQERQPSHRTAESICTDGGGLVASDDSDWTYLHEDGFKLQ